MLLDADFRFINQEFYADHVEPRQMDKLLEDGWRHFGTHFFRYNLGVFDNEIRRVIPLRIRVSDFQLSKSLRRTLKRNMDLETAIRPIRLDAETEELFFRHKQRFRSGTPASVYDFISAEPATVPSPAAQVVVTNEGRLLATSFFDIGDESISSIYGMFEPADLARGLGIFTMLKEIEYAREKGLEYYYHGYAYEGPSFYDYKKRFAAMEEYDWRGNWIPFTSR